MEEENNLEIDLGRYFAALRQWYRLILLVTILAAAAGLIVSFATPPTYEAEADVAIIKSGTQVNLDPKIVTVSEVGQTQQQSQVDQAARRKSLTTIAKSANVASAVIAKIGDRLTKGEQIPANLLGAIDVTNDGDLIKLKAKANSPEKAALIANTWAEAYESSVNGIYGDTAQSPADVQAQADSAKRDYDGKETALVAYLKNSPIDGLTRQIDLKKQKLADSVTIGNKLDRLLADATSLKSRLTFSVPSSGRGTELAGVLLDASAFSTWSTLPVNLQIPIDQLSAGSTPTEQLNNLDKLIATLQDRRNNVQADIVGPLQQEVNQLQSQLEQENAKKQELTRARDLAWSTYTTLSNQVAQVNVAAQAKGTVVRQAVSAIAPEPPVAPKKTTNTLLAGLVGLVLGVGAVLLLEFLNDSMTNEDQVTKELGLATIGAIPELAKANAKSSGPMDYPAMVLDKDSRSAAMEALRLLRYNLIAREGETARQVFMLASALPAEGKSTVAANLAALMASAGKPVLLVDADFRGPTQHKFFGLKNDFGLYNILNNSLDNWETYTQTTEIDGLRVVTSGPLPSDPAALLDSPAMAGWIERLKREAGIVIIDTPAVLGLADATILARVVDGIVMVVGAGAVSRHDAARAKENLAATGVPIIGVVLNRADGLPGALTYEHYARHHETPALSANGQTKWLTAVRDRLVALVGPGRRG